MCDASGSPLTMLTPHRVGLEVRYWREVTEQTPIAGEEVIIHADADLVVADKPHFLPVAPTGEWVEQTLLRRLQNRLGVDALAPLHRIDRTTAGLVMFSVNPKTRAAYHDLFRLRRIGKVYHALAPPLPEQQFPLTRRSHLTRGTPFFRIEETPGEPNAETRIEVLTRGSRLWRYELRPHTGHKHQLRVHMAALGAAIDGDTYYPVLLQAAADNYARPLSLLAHSVSFRDPLSGISRSFTTSLKLSAS